MAHPHSQLPSPGGWCLLFAWRLALCSLCGVSLGCPACGSSLGPPAHTGAVPAPPPAGSRLWGKGHRTVWSEDWDGGGACIECLLQCAPVRLGVSLFACLPVAEGVLAGKTGQSRSRPLPKLGVPVFDSPGTWTAAICTKDLPSRLAGSPPPRPLRCFEKAVQQAGEGWAEGGASLLRTSSRSFWHPTTGRGDAHGCLGPAWPRHTCSPSQPPRHGLQARIPCRGCGEAFDSPRTAWLWVSGMGSLGHWATLAPRKARPPELAVVAA